MLIRRSNTKGFTLIELMIVVVIVGILTALAVPRFMQVTTKSKQSEAKLILKQVYVNQRTYRQQSLTNSYYQPAGAASNAAPLAFRGIWVEVATPARYTYTIVAAADQFTCTAEGNIDDDAALDTWVIDQSGVMTNTINDVIL